MRVLVKPHCAIVSTRCDSESDTYAGTAFPSLPQQSRAAPREPQSRLYEYTILPVAAMCSMASDPKESRYRAKSSRHAVLANPKKIQSHFYHGLAGVTASSTAGPIKGEPTERALVIACLILLPWEVGPLMSTANSSDVDRSQCQSAEPQPPPRLASSTRGARFLANQSHWIRIVRQASKDNGLAFLYLQRGAQRLFWFGLSTLHQK